MRSNLFNSLAILWPFHLILEILCSPHDWCNVDMYWASETPASSSTKSIKYLGKWLRKVHHSHALPHAWVTVDLAGKAATAIAYPKPSRKPSKELGWYMWVCWVGFKKATAYSELRGRGQYCLISFQWCRRLPSEHFENKYCLICYSSIIISSSESFVVLLLADITALVEVTELVWGFNKISSQIFTFSSIAYWPFSLLHCF